MSYLDDIARASKTPTFSTLEAAQKMFPGLTLDAYTMARVINSEYGSGSAVELCAIGDADLNKANAAGKSIYQHATNGSGYGAQGDRAGGGGDRPVSSARAPGPRHVMAALAVLGGAARGISRGARRYFDPNAMNKGFAAYRSGTSTKVISCSAIGLLEAWTFARPSCGGSRCCANGLPVAGPDGSGQEEWVGPIEGVNPYELMLMRPATSQQSALYATARQVIESRGSYRPGTLPTSSSGALFAVAGILALAGAGIYYVKTTRPRWWR